MGQKAPSQHNERVRRSADSYLEELKAEATRVRGASPGKFPEESQGSKALLIVGRYSFSASATAALRGPDQLTKIIFSNGIPELYSAGSIAGESTRWGFGLRSAPGRQGFSDPRQLWVSSKKGTEASMILLSPFATFPTSHVQQTMRARVEPTRRIYWPDWNLPERPEQEHPSHEDSSAIYVGVATTLTPSASAHIIVDSGLGASGTYSAVAVKRLPFGPRLVASIRDAQPRLESRGQHHQRREAEGAVLRSLWVKQAIDAWLQTAEIEEGPIFRRVSASGRVGEGALTERAVWQLVREYAAQVGIGELAPHDLRRTAAKLCRSKGGELEQMQFLLGHESILTTERYLGSEQNLKNAVNDALVFE
jgi:Phage integrase family